MTWQDSAGLAGPDGVNKSDLADATDLSKDSITKAVRDSVYPMGNLVDYSVLVEREVYEELYLKLYDTLGFLGDQEGCGDPKSLGDAVWRATKLRYEGRNPDH